MPSVDRYFRAQAGRDAARGLAAVFVVVLPDDKLAGFYTLAPATVLLPDLLSGGIRKISRYPALPAARLTRLAVDKRQRGQGLARAMLQDAMARLVESRLKPVALIAEAPVEAARHFYAHAGFQAFPERAHQLFRPLRAT